jgi:hypothetical protein
VYGVSDDAWARIPIHSQAMRPLPSSIGPGPSPPCYKPYRFVLVVGGVVGGVGFGSTGFSRAADLLDTVEDGEIGTSTKLYVNKREK